MSQFTSYPFNALFNADVFMFYQNGRICIASNIRDLNLKEGAVTADVCNDGPKTIYKNQMSIIYVSEGKRYLSDK